MKVMKVKRVVLRLSTTCRIRGRFPHLEFEYADDRSGEYHNVQAFPNADERVLNQDAPLRSVHVALAGSRKRSPKDVDFFFPRAHLLWGHDPLRVR
jgi:hypothetical protein